MKLRALLRSTKNINYKEYYIFKNQDNLILC